MPQIPFESNAIWDICKQNNIGANASLNINYTVISWLGKLTLSDSSPGATSRERAFVLFSPALTNRTINSLLSVRKEHRVPSGFRVADAAGYSKVYVVGDFPQNELDLLEDPATIDAKVVRITGTKKEMRDRLEALLNP